MGIARNLARIIADNSGAISAANLTNAPNPILPGTIAYVGMNSTPTGWLKANGAAVSRTTYAALFSAIGTTYGSGDGSTTFNLPDLRGEFPRGFDDGRGVDSGRSFGSAQLDQMQKITGQFDLGTGNSGARMLGGSGSGAFTLLTASGSGLVQIVSYGATYTVGHSFDSALSPNARVSSTTSGETRSRNIALLACIKF